MGTTCRDNTLPRLELPPDHSVQTRESVLNSKEPKWSRPVRIHCYLKSYYGNGGSQNCLHWRDWESSTHPYHLVPLELSVLTRLQDNPLHISLFPPYSDSTIEFSFLLNSCLDIFDIRCKQTSIDQDLGLLHAIDERLAAYGWLTTTGVKLLIIVDLFGQEEASAGKQAGAAINGLRDSDVKPVCFPSISRECFSTESTHPLIISYRHSAHYRVHIFSFCRIHSIPPMTTYPFPGIQRLLCPLASQSLTKSSLRMLNVSGIRGLQVLLCRESTNLIHIKPRSTSFPSLHSY